MNKVILLGRVTKDIEYKQTSSTGYARFTVAVDRPKMKDQESQADFINCVAWGKTGENIAKYFGKGRKILVEGRIQTGSYTNKENVKVNTFDVWVSNFEFVESAKQNNQGSSMESFGSPVAPFDAEIPF